MYDSLDLEVFQGSKTYSDFAFRFLDDMNQNLSFYRIAAANTTTLSSNLSLTDSNIYVTNASVLPTPQPTQNIPGVVFINGEKITYYTIDKINNVLGQIRRAVDGTSPSNVHVVGERVVDSSVQQQMPYSANGNVILSATTTYTTTDTVVYVINLTGTTSANIGDSLKQINANTSEVISTMRCLQTVANSTQIPVIITSGGILGLPDVYDNPVGFDIQSFDNTIGGLSINGSEQPVYVIDYYVLGNYRGTGNLNQQSMTTAGTITVSSGAKLITGNIWYDRGLTTATNGTGLVNSHTPQAVFLKASPGFAP